MRRIRAIVRLVVALGGALLLSTPWTATRAQMLPQPSQSEVQPFGYVLQWGEGEKLILGRRRAPFNIKVSPKTGSQHLIMGTEQIAGGTAITVHMHEYEDEIIFIHKGEATVVIGENSEPAKEGATVYIPKGTWHAIQNHGESKPVEMLWIFSQPGMDDAFRAFSVPIGAPPKQLTPEEVENIRRKHGLRQKTP